MPISIKSDIIPLIEGREGVEGPADALKRRFPKDSAVIGELVSEFKKKYESTDLIELQQGRFCEFVQTWIDSKNLDPTLKEAIHMERLAIFRQLMCAKKAEFKLPSDAGVSRSGAGNGRLANGTNGHKRNKEQISEVVMQYAQLAVYMGDNVALDILEKLGVLKPGERAHAMSAISQFLGECASPDGGDVLVGVLGSPDIILQDMSVYEKMQHSMVEHCYHGLMELNADTLENQPHFLGHIEFHIHTMLDQLYKKAFGSKSRTVSGSHQDLYDDVVNQFKAAASYKIPDHMAQTATDHNGVVWPLGSWRQRLVISNLFNPQKRHVYNGMGAGDGKTFTHFWAYELTKQERKRNGLEGPARLAMFLPKAVGDEVPGRVRKESARKKTDSLYYKDPSKAPTVGTIRKGMSIAEIREHASRDIVFCAYSMWHRSRKEKTRENGKEKIEKVSIADLLIKQEKPFTNLSFDEAHLLQGDKTHTRLARRTIREIPGLYANGHIMASSATPVTGHLAGLRVVLELLEKPSAEGEPGERRMAGPNQWAELRRMMGKLWMMDKPENWMRNVERHEYPLSPQEYEMLQLIIEDNTMPAHQKLSLSQLIIRCPRLISGDSEMPWTSFQETTKHLNSLLRGDGRSTVLVAENMLSNCVLQKAQNPDKDALADPENYFFKALEHWCTEQGITFHVIHGGVDEDDRIAIYEDMQEAQKTKRKCVLYAHSGCLNLGIDLRFIEGIISQQWPYNTPDLYQLLKRALRMKNTGCRVIVTSARDTVEEGILTAAELKHADGQRCLYGAVLSDDRMSELSDAGEVRTDNENIAQRIESTEQKWRRFARALHGAGTAKVQEFWKRHENDFIVMLDQKDSSSIGDSERAVASLVLELEDMGLLPESGQYLQTCSNGQSLANMLFAKSPEKLRQIRSMDAIQPMLDYGSMYRPDYVSPTGHIEATPDSLYHLVNQGIIPAASQDLVVLNGLEQATHSILEDGGFQWTGRVRALKGAAEALKNPSVTTNADGTQTNGLGGLMIIPLDCEFCTETELNQLRLQLMSFGCEVMDDYSGLITSKDNEGEPPHKMYVITAQKIFDVKHEDLSADMDPAGLVLTKLQGREAKTKSKTRKLPFALPHEQFKIGRRQLKKTIPTVGRDQKLKFLERLTVTVREIQSLASSSQDMIGKLKLKAFQQRLKDLGVICFPHFNTEGNRKPSKKKKSKEGEDAATTECRLTFRFTDSPHTFYPFDKQWIQKPDAAE